jgi:hypothetical protein
MDGKAEVAQTVMLNAAGASRVQIAEGAIGACTTGVVI